MQTEVSSVVVEKWLKAWSLSRGLACPVQYKSGFKVHVHDEKQKIRYVFPKLDDNFIQLLNDVDEPHVFLKVCTGPGELKNVIPRKWMFQPQGYMMACRAMINAGNASLDRAYKLESAQNNSVFTIRILTQTGELAASGHLVLVDGLAVYDRIKTESKHRRKGLAMYLMKELEKIALSKGVFNNFLVATEEGKSLYEFLGWQLYSLYTTIVIANKNS